MIERFQGTADEVRKTAWVWAFACWAVALGACGNQMFLGRPDLGGGTNGAADDPGETDGAADDPGGDGGSDDGSDGGSGPEFSRCFEAEELERFGAAQLRAAAPETAGGTVVLGAGAGVRVPFSLEGSQDVGVWIRARAVTAGRNSLSLQLGEPSADLAAVWDIPITPVLRMQRASRRGPSGTYYRADESQWPGTLESGAYELTVTGVEEGVEIDQICVASAADEPEERWASVPERSPTHDVSAFGAVGDGMADDTAALQGAIDALQPGDALHIGAGRYRFTSTVLVGTSEVSIVGDGPQTVLFADFPAQATGDALAIMGPSLAAAEPLVRDAAIHDWSIAVATTSPIQAGDTIMISSDPWGPTSTHPNMLHYRHRANFAHVTEVVESQGERALVLDRQLLSPFAVQNNANVVRVEFPRAVVMANLAVEGTNRGSSADNADINLVHALRSEGCFFVDLQVTGMRKAGIDIGLSLDTRVIRLHAANATDTGEGGHGYGVTSTASQGVVVRDSLFDGTLRHGIVIDRGSREAFVWANTFDRRANHTNNLGSIDIHGEDNYANLAENNEITGGRHGIIVGGGGSTHANDGSWNVLRGNTIAGAEEGIAVYKQTFDTVIEGNTIEQSPEGVVVEGGSKRTLIWRNEIAGWGQVGVGVRDSNQVELFLNRFAPGSGPGIEIRGGSEYVIRENAMGGAQIVEPGTGLVGDNS